MKLCSTQGSAGCKVRDSWQSKIVLLLGLAMLSRGFQLGFNDPSKTPDQLFASLFLRLGNLSVMAGLAVMLLAWVWERFRLREASLLDRISKLEEALALKSPIAFRSSEVPPTNMVPSWIHLCLFLIFFLGLFVVAPMGQLKVMFGVWASLNGAILWGIGFHYHDEIVINRAPGLILAGILICIVG